MAPFAGYADFAACVKANSDKANPEAYCAYVHHEATGEWPGEASHRAQAIPPRILVGVEVFSVGRHDGRDEDWTADKLDLMVKGFEAGHNRPVPVKLGHTSDAFNAQIAAELGVPVSAFRGEGDDPLWADGVLALGEMTALRRLGDKLYADLSLPEPVARLVTNGYLSNVSLEMLSSGKGAPWEICGIALLSAETPAVADLSGLAAAVVMSRARRPALAFSRPLGQTVARPDAQKLKGGRVSLFDSVMERLGLKDKDEAAVLSRVGEIAKYAEEREAAEAEKQASGKKSADEVLSFLQVLLGLDPASDAAAVIEAVRRLLGLPDAATMQEAGQMMRAKMTQAATADATKQNFRESAEFKAAVAEETKALRDSVSALERDRRIANWRAQAVALTAVPGTPDEHAARLAGIEEKIGADEAKRVFADLTALQKMAVEKGVGTAIGTAGDPNAKIKHPFESVIEKYAADNKVTRQKAMALLSHEKPVEFDEYMRSQRAA